MGSRAIFCFAMVLSAWRPAAPAAEGDWPTVQHDMQRSGYTAACPEPPYRIRWIWTNGDRLDPAKLAAAIKDRSNLFELFPDVVMTRFMNHAQPMVADGVAYIASVSGSTGNPAGPGELFAIDVGTGKTKWRVATSGPAFHCVTVADGTVFVATARGLDAFGTDGKKRWTGYEQRGLDGLIGNWQEHNFHWGGTTCGTILPDAVLVSPFGGLYIVCYESQPRQGGR